MQPDISMFSAEDAFNISLQRTSHIRIPLTFKLWAMGYPSALRFEATLRRRAIICGAIDDANREFENIKEYLGQRTIKKIVDIGCGHALIDLLFWQTFKCDIHLVDIESTKTHHHGFKNSGSGYASLVSAREYLIKNGVPEEKIRITNPNKSTLMDKNCDLIFSLLSCGFHYPASTYLNFIKTALKPNGVFLFDLRKKSNQEYFLDAFARSDILNETNKSMRIAAIKK